jgi:hypothetical protein
MVEVYQSGDPYLAFAKQAGAVLPTATKQTDSREREQFKKCILGVKYAMGAGALGQRIGRCAPRVRGQARRCGEHAGGGGYRIGRARTVAEGMVRSVDAK